MNIFLKKAEAVLAAVLIAAALSSCGGKNSVKSSANDQNMVGGGLDGDVNIKPADMPYGASMTRLNKDKGGVPISIEYDHNFLTEDEGKAVSNYISVINKKDADLFNEISFGPVKGEILSLGNVANAEEYVTGLYNSVKAYAGDNFDMSMLIVNSAENTGADVLDDMVQKNAPDAKVTDKKLVTVDIYYDTPEASNQSLYKKMGSYFQLYIYTIDGKPYIMA